MLSGYKTYILAAAAIAGAVANYLVGDAQLDETVRFVVEAMLAATIRHGIATKE